MTDRKKTDRKKQPIPPAEWVVAALGLVLTVLLLAFLIRSALDGPRQPPDITVAVDSVIRLESGWLAFVTAENAGDETAADVTLEGVIGGVEQRSTAVLDFLPPGSRRSAVLMFGTDPGARLAVRASGFR